MVASGPSADNRSAELKDAFEVALSAHRSGRLSDAESAFRHVLALAPEHPDALHLLGLSLHFQGRSEEGIALIKRAIARVPENPAYYNNLGNVLDDIGVPGAEAAYRKATQLSPDYPIAWCVLGTRALARKELSEALTYFHNALRAKPDYSPAENGIGIALLKLGQPNEAAAHYRAALRLDPNNQSAASNLLMMAQYNPDNSAAVLRDAHKGWGDSIESRLPIRTKPFANSRDPERRLKIGYVSADFRMHSVAYFIEPVITAHDGRAVEVTLYSAVRRADAVTQRIRGKADHWRDIFHLPDEAVARLIEKDRIDILVDLSGHTSGNRLGVFALQPAPVQASWIGYPDITGLSKIGWRMTDAVADPELPAESARAETLMRLPDGFLCYQPPADAPPIAPLVADAERPITFGSFNSSLKISSDTVALWSRVLNAVPDSKLLLKTEFFGEEKVRARLLHAFATHGIPEERLELRPYVQDVDGHLATYRCIDIALDTVPYNGTTTTMEALWMGRPVVTLRGDRHAARVGASLLARAGLADLVAETSDAFVQIAAELAADRARLASLSVGMRDRLARTTLLDAERFTQGVEVAYRAMWQRFLTEGL